MAKPDKIDNPDTVHNVDNTEELEGTSVPDQPMGVEEFGVTPAEEQAQETPADRLAREEPDVIVPPEDLPGGVGRLVSPNVDMVVDVEAAEIASDAGTDDGDFTAEEAAMHVEDE